MAREDTPPDHPLQGSRMFGDASPELRQAFERIMTRLRLAPGEVLFDQGDPGDTLYLLEEGLLEISVLSAEGRRLALNMLRSGDVFGEIALFDPGPRTATVTAIAACTLRQIRRSDLFEAIHARPELAIEMIRLAGSRLRWVSRQLEEQVFLSTASRLALKLLYLAGISPKGPDTIVMSQADLADHIGATREIVSKTLAEWARSGWIEVGRGRVTLRDRDALENAANPDLF